MYHTQLLLPGKWFYKKYIWISNITIKKTLHQVNCLRKFFVTNWKDFTKYVLTLKWNSQQWNNKQTEHQQNLSFQVVGVNRIVVGLRHTWSYSVLDWLSRLKICPCKNGNRKIGEIHVCLFKIELGKTVEHWKDHWTFRMLEKLARNERKSLHTNSFSLIDCQELETVPLFNHSSFQPILSLYVFLVIPSCLLAFFFIIFL